MHLPQLPRELFILTPLLFIAFVVLSNFRYGLSPNNYIGHSTTFASLVIGFIFLYGMQKYDKMDGNVPVVERNIVYLQEMALKYDPSLLCLLIQYVVNFLDFTNDEFPILEFEKKILPLISNEEEYYRVRESVTILELISHQRISGENLIADPIWFLIYIVALLLTLIFPMDKEFKSKTDSIIVIVLIWFPIITIYFLYMSELDKLQNTMDKLIKELSINADRKGIQCEYEYYNDASCEYK